MKHFFDFLLAVVVFSILLIPLGFCALLIRFRLGSPVFFVQERPGLNGELFRLIKFRTMADQRDGAGQLLPDGERMTTFGSWLRSSSLDELPELINILKGDMSFVGPRPLLPEYLPLYSEQQARRHDVRPGITGWAQVNGRNALDWDERFEMDVWYVENRNLWLDLKIVWLTFFTVLKKDDVSAEGHVTMPKFEGSGDHHEPTGSVR